jgi:hypothetical protein
MWDLELGYGDWGTGSGFGVPVSGYGWIHWAFFFFLNWWEIPYREFVCVCVCFFIHLLFFRCTDNVRV